MTGDSKVLILTQSVFGGNYGGILQAYALQRVISDLGYDVKTQATLPATGPKEEVTTGLKNAVKRVLKYTGVRDHAVVPPPSVKSEIVAEQMRFVDNHMRLEHTPPGASTLNEYQAFVVGSDQVWRAAYSDLAVNFLDFTRGRKVKRIAYAASFGRDDLEGYSPEQIAQSRRLAGEFDAISVRESSGIEICRNTFDVTASLVLDPTLLLEHADYLQHLNSVPQSQPSAAVFTYVLDRDPHKQRITATVAELLNLEVDDFRPQDFTTVGAYRNAPARYQNPPIEKWLSGIANSQFVVTDSFHGTVFAIIFNKPFLCVGNASRGLTRFESLLGPLGLTERMASEYQGISKESLAAPIDWAGINSKLSERRTESLNFLREALNG